MFCEKCGTGLGASDKFCPSCGTMVSTVSVAPQTAPVHPAAMQPVQAAHAVAGKEKKKKGINIMVLLTSAFMCFATFKPFVDLDRGFLGNIASGLLGDNMPGVSGDHKYNFYQLISEGRSFVGDYQAILIAVMVFVVITMVVAFVSGITNKKGLLILTGFMSIICLGLGVAYMIYSNNLVDTFNSEVSNGIDSVLGDYGDVIGGAIQIKNINGTGLYMFLVASGVQALFSFIGAAGKRR